MKDTLKERTELVSEHVGRIQEASGKLRQEIGLMKDNARAAKEIVSRRVEEVVQLIRDAELVMLQGIEQESGRKGIRHCVLSYMWSVEIC